MSTHPANVNQPQVRIFNLDEPKEENQYSSPYKPFFDKAKELPSGQGVEIVYPGRYRAILAAQGLRALILSAGLPMKVSQRGTKVKIWKM